MKLRHENVYDAPASLVFAMLSNTDFREQAAKGAGALSAAATFDGGRMVVKEEQVVAGVPSFAKKFVGDSTKVIHTEVWDAAGTRGTFEIETPGKPTHIKGTVSLVENAGKTTHAYDLDVTASVPLIGGKLEKLVAELTAKGLEKEHEVATAWLAERA